MPVPPNLSPEERYWLWQSGAISDDEYFQNRPQFSTPDGPSDYSPYSIKELEAMLASGEMDMPTYLRHLNFQRPSNDTTQRPAGEIGSQLDWTGTYVPDYYDNWDSSVNYFNGPFNPGLTTPASRNPFIPTPGQMNTDPSDNYYDEWWRFMDPGNTSGQFPGQNNPGGISISLPPFGLGGGGGNNNGGGGGGAGGSGPGGQGAGNSGPGTSGPGDSGTGDQGAGDQGAGDQGTNDSGPGGNGNAGGGGMGANIQGWINTGGNILGSVLGYLNGAPSEWLRNRITNQQQVGMAGYGSVLDPWWKMYEGAVMPGYEWANRSDELRGSPAANIGAYSNLNPTAITELYRALGMNTTPDMEQTQQNLGGVANSLNPSRDTAGLGFQGGGWTPMYQQLFDRGNDMLTGRGWQNALPADVGGNLLGQRGQDVYSRMMQDAMTGGINTGGMNPYLAAGQDIALGDLAMGGMTPGLQGLQGRGAGFVTQGGKTPESQAMAGVGVEGLLRGGGTDMTDLLQGRGAELFNQEALLPMESAISAAGDMAANQATSQFEAAQRRADARGGGPGPVRGGIQNKGMAEYADQASRLVSDAQNAAMMNQQNLQLQQRGLGGQTATGAGQLEAGRLGQFGDITGKALGLDQGLLGLGNNMVMSPEQIAAARMGQSYGAIPGMQGAGTNVMSALITAGMGGQGTELARMGLGGNLLQGYNQNRQQALGTLGQIQGAQNNYALGLGGLQSNMAGQQGSLLNSQFQNWLGGATSGIQRANAIQSGWLGAQQGSQNWNNLANSMWSTGMGMPMNAMSQLTDLAKGWQNVFDSTTAAGTANV